MSEITEMPATIRDYLAGRLPDADARDFEERFARDPEVVRAMEDVLRLREGLATLRDQGTLAELVTPRRSPVRRWTLVASAAALAAVAVFVGMRLLGGSPLLAASIASLKGPDARPSIAARYSFAAMRQAAAAPILDLPPGGALELRILAPEASTAAVFRVSLQVLDAAGMPLPVGSVGELVRDADGFVAVYADAARLKPGDYLISVAPERSVDAAAGRIAFTLRRAASGSRAAQ